MKKRFFARRALSFVMVLSLVVGFFANSFPLTASANSSSWDDALTVAQVKAITGVTNGGANNPIVRVKGYLTSKSAPSNTQIVNVLADDITVTSFETSNAIQLPQTASYYIPTDLKAKLDAAPVGTLVGIQGTVDLYNGKYSIEKMTAVEYLSGDVTPPPTPGPGLYDAVIASITDGDTVKLADSLFGSNTVRMLNIDTAETYHSANNALDQNQKDFGLAAKAHMETLLKPGDQVTLKIGDEVKDTYGRLLAEVIRKSDQVNVNLEMVKSGHAVTYFIWPIGPEASYLEYQAAVKAANDQGLGIWNPTNPLQELPFVFRSREQGREIARPVGHFDTKHYVPAASWADVPVEKRVFFNTEADALANGYTPVGTTPPADPTSVLKLSVMGTTDIHANIANYNYYTDKPVEDFGLAKTATLIKAVRAANPNTLLVDNGDTIQGTPLGEYLAKEKVFAEGEKHPIYDVMNLIGYDAATLGNHEFNYGLEYLDRALKTAEFPVVSANVYDAASNAPYYTPYVIEERTFTDAAGQPVTLKVGFTGFVPPQINVWDSRHLDGKVETKDIAETAKHVIPAMKAAGADIIIVMAHTGIEGYEQASLSENMVFDLTRVPGITAIVSGHQHNLFPGDSRFNNIPAIDNVKGTINGVPVVMPKQWGNHLGVMELTLNQVNGQWVLADSQSRNLPIYDTAAKKSLADPDPAVLAAIEAAHQETLTYVRTPVGTTTAPINSFFASVQDDPSVQIVNDAQKWYIQGKLADAYKDLPILSAAAPFKNGRNGAADYTNIPAGGLAIKNIGDLYLYDNTVQAVKITGAELKEWLEMSAGRFNTIDPASTTEQNLINTSFQAYNFDVIDGVTYQIDVTKAPKYSTSGALLNANSSRIVNLKFEGKPINPAQEFIVVTNNYRASGGGNFPGINPSKIVYKSPDENREALMNYILEQRTIDPSADGNWSLAPINAPVNVTFTSAPEAKDFANEKLVYLSEVSGLSKFSINMAGSVTDPTDPVDPTAPIKVKLLGVNDLHGKIDVSGTVTGDSNTYGRIDYLAAYLKKAAANNPNTLLVHAGDMIGGSSPVSKLFQEEPTIEIMNAMGFDIGTLGNHEFDAGLTELQRLIAGGKHPNGTADFAGFAFPHVAANIQYKANKELVFKPYEILEAGGAKIAFIGVATKSTPSIVIPTGIQDIEFTDEVEAINRFVPEIQAQGVKAIVVLAHVSASQDANGTITNEIGQMAPKLNQEVDVIFAAHNHETVNGKVGNILVVQAWEYGKAFSEVDLEIDPVTKDIVKKSANIVRVAQQGVTPDPEVSAILNKYLDLVAPKVNQVVGTSATNLVKGYPIKGALGDNGLGNLIADGMAWYMNADFALMNGGGVRDNVNVGEITWGELFNVQPFGNTLVKLDVTGAQFKEILDAMISPAYGPDSFIAGASYLWSEQTNKVVDIYLKNGQPIDPQQTYSLVVNNFMFAQTTAKYKLLAQYGKNVVNGPEDIEATVAFIKSFNNQPVTYTAEGRMASVYPKAVLTAPKYVLSGYEFDVAVSAKDITGIYGSDLTVQFNPNDFELLDVRSLLNSTEGDSFLVTKTDVPGEVRILFTRNGQALAADQDYLKLVFKSKTGASSEIRIKQAVYADGLTHNQYGARSSVTVFSTNGDINGVGGVDIGDIAFIARYFLATSAHPEWSQAQRADLNRDGIVDIADLVIISRIVLSN